MQNKLHTFVKIKLPFFPIINHPLHQGSFPGSTNYSRSHYQSELYFVTDLLWFSRQKIVTKTCHSSTKITWNKKFLIFDWLLNISAIGESVSLGKWRVCCLWAKLHWVVCTYHIFFQIIIWHCNYGKSVHYQQLCLEKKYIPWFHCASTLKWWYVFFN